MKRIATLFSCALLALPLMVDARGPGQGTGKGDGSGRKAGSHDACSGLVVVAADGSEKRFDKVDDFFAPIQTIMIDQGEESRTAAPLDTVLKQYKAGWAEAQTCDDRTAHLPSGAPWEGRELLVLTGKGGLKAVREVKDRSYVNTVKKISKLTFHASGSGQGPQGDRK